MTKITIPKKKTFPSRELDQINVRLPDGLRDKLNELATLNSRSTNSEIVSILQVAVAKSADKMVATPMEKLRHSLEIIIDEAIGMQSSMAELAKQKPDQ